MPVELVPHGPEHLEQTWLWMQDDGLRALIDSRFPAPSRETNARVWAERWTNVSRADYAVISDDLHVGNCGLLLDSSPAEAWLYIAAGYRGRGVGRDAARLLLASQAGAQVRVLWSNPQALAFWRSAGFTKEAVSTDSGVRLELDDLDERALEKDLSVGARNRQDR